MHTVKVKCFRFDPQRDKSPHFDSFTVPIEAETRVSDCLEFIRLNLDPTLAFFINCKRGTCGRCTMRINGKPQLACMTIVEGDIQVEPLKAENVIRDLWVTGI